MSDSRSPVSGGRYRTTDIDITNLVVGGGLILFINSIDNTGINQIVLVIVGISSQSVRLLEQYLRYPTRRIQIEKSIPPKQKSILSSPLQISPVEYKYKTK